MFNYKKFKELRKEKNFSVEEIAEKIGSTSATIYQYQSGKTNPSKQVIEKIAATLEVTLSELVTPVVKKDWKEEAYSKLESENKRLWLMIEYLTKGAVTFDVGKMLGNRENVGAKEIALSVTPSKLRA